MTTRKETAAKINRLAEMVEMLQSDLTLDDPAFWSNIDNRVLDDCIRKLDKLTYAIEDERK